MARFRGHWYVWLRTAQGSRGAPLTWAALAALLARCTQGLLALGQDDEARLQVYVDDPLLGLRGSDKRRRRLACRFCVCFIILGFQVAFTKAQLASTVVWIGVGLSVSPRRVEAFIPKEKLANLQDIIVDMLHTNVVPIKSVRSLAGKSMNIASLIAIWRPFLAPFWAVLSQHSTKAPKNCIWTRQILWALLWLQEFILENSGAITRVFEYEAYLPSHGSHEGQQAFEAFVILVAIRTWQPLFQRRRAALSVRSDNRGALAVLASLKGSGDALTLVAKELALDLGRCEYFPRVISHLPGVANVTADILSRKYDPSKPPWSVPDLLRNVPPADMTVRNSDWWRTYALEQRMFARHARSHSWGANS